MSTELKLRSQVLQLRFRLNRVLYIGFDYHGKANRFLVQVGGETTCCYRREDCRAHPFFTDSDKLPDAEFDRLLDQALKIAVTA